MRERVWPTRPIQEPSTSIEKRQGSNLKHLSQQVTKMLRKDPLTASKPAQKAELKTEKNARENTKTKQKTVHSTPIEKKKYPNLKYSNQLVKYLEMFLD
jgi:hypothetical protein